MTRFGGPAAKPGPAKSVGGGTATFMRADSSSQFSRFSKQTLRGSPT
jgi:hypothetical protein